MKGSKTILITGGLGFIGTHLCRALLHLDQAAKITVVDNLSSNKMDFEDLRGRVRIVVQDLRHYEYSSERFDEIYHLASPVGSLGILNRNGYIALDIIQLTHKVVEIALALNSKLLFVSSSEVYGHDGAHIESDPKIVYDKHGTRMEYALAKLISEHILYDIANNNGLDFRICRPFNAIGEDQSPLNGFVVPIFFQNALTGQPLPVFYGGSQKRSFCHVADIVSALIVVQNQGRSKEVYNIGNPRDVISILSLAQEIVKICCSQSEILEVDPQVVYGAAYIEAAEKIPNIKKLQKHTGWFPTIDLASSLTRILDYYKIHEIGVPGHPKTSPIYVK